MNLKIIALLSTTVLVSACSTTAKIQYLEPSEIPQAAKLKQIAVNDFKDDSIGLTGKIESKLNQTTLNNKPYFTVLDRKNIQQLLNEQKLQHSGLTNEQKSVQLGELIGAQAFVTGEVTSQTYQDHWVRKKRSECIDKKCKELRYYYVRCVNRTISLSANIQMLAVESSQIIYSDSLSRSDTWEHCSDRNNQLPSVSATWQSYANSIAGEFVNKISPNYVYKKITLLDEPDINYSDIQKNTLENGIDFVESGRLDKAESLFSQLVFDTQSLSYVATYNLGVVKEAQGDYQEAKRLYSLSDQLQKEPVEEINQALIRIDQAIVKHQQAMNQIAQ
ncbi:hypothetical protein THMIRHAM_10330 [Thiomicrorhabdus immobilis]|uniref:Curli production assembly/transport component CsgG n=1 Tax=Thiomicrorhabdus immobilis TaxID=2791037 RepID=A0ABM7MD20_9GAMM|nr:CsgG/HfaB family protein [Thiomicrorhabdus immobilis]BCN93248.1 hypothetical protein THMIRHAM_10330 [Thiomicrorhabdus immobilis]